MLLNKITCTVTRDTWIILEITCSLKSMNSLSILSNYEGTYVVRLSVLIEVSCIANREASVVRSSVRSHRFRFDESKILKKSVGSDNTVTILFVSLLNMARGDLLILNITYCK